LIRNRSACAKVCTVGIFSFFAGRLVCVGPTEVSISVEVAAQLVDYMGGFAGGGEVMNLTLWLGWYAFNVIGKISFSKQFSFLEQGKEIENTLIWTF
jgi:hypothetical protein